MASIPPLPGQTQSTLGSAADKNDDADSEFGDLFADDDILMISAQDSSNGLSSASSSHKQAASEISKKDDTSSLMGGDRHKSLEGGRVPCAHACKRKDLCEHPCCKKGVLAKVVSRRKRQNDPSSDLHPFETDFDGKIEEEFDVAKEIPPSKKRRDIVPLESTEAKFAADDDEFDAVSF